jgi:hypothetical protein
MKQSPSFGGMVLKFRPFFQAAIELKMPGFQGISAWAGKSSAAGMPSFNDGVRCPV